MIFNKKQKKVRNKMYKLSEESLDLLFELKELTNLKVADQVILNALKSYKTNLKKVKELKEELEV